MSLVLAGPATGRRSFALPLTFLGTGVAAYVALHVLITLGLPRLAASYFRNPYALLVTHLFTLGFVTAIIMGAMYQLVPVILETPLWNQRVGYAHLVLYLVGLVGMLVGFWRFDAPWLVSGGILVATAAALFVLNLLMTMRRAKTWHVAATFLVFSMVYLALTVTWGLLLVFNIHHGFFATATRGNLVVHATIGFGGWFTLTIMGVAYRLLPLFTLSHHKPGWQTTTVLVLTNAGVVGLATAFALGAPTWLEGGFLAVAAAGVALFLREMHGIIHGRARKELDLGVRFSMAAFVSLAFSVVLAAALLAAPAPFVTPGRSVGLMYLIGMGWVGMMVVGQMYKIVPFLVWTSRHAPRAGKEKVPLLRDMYSQGIARWAFRTLAAGIPAVVLGLWAGWLPLATAGSTVAAAGGCLFAYGMCTIYRR